MVYIQASDKFASLAIVPNDVSHHQPKSMTAPNVEYRGIVDSLNDVVFQSDLDGHCVYLNPAWERLSGYSVKETLGKSILFVVHPDDASGVRYYLKNLLEGKSVQYGHEMRCHDRSGKVHWTELRAALAFDGNGSPVGVCGTVSDITLRKQTEEELNAASSRLVTLMDNLHTGVMMVDKTGIITHINETYCTYLGVEAAPLSLMGMEARHVTHEVKKKFTDPMAFISRLSEILLDSKEVLNEEVELEDGRVFERSFIPIHVEESYQGYLWLHRDATVRRKTGTELIVAKRAAEEASAAKNEFVANMSHELRTPLNTIIGNADLALNSSLNQEQRSQLEQVSRAGQSLLTMINDILDFSKLEDGSFTLDHLPFSLRDCLSPLFEQKIAASENDKVTLDLDIADGVPDGLVGDPGRLRETLNHLVSNAIKFTQQGQIQVNIALKSRADNKVHLEFSVSDTGIGIAAEMQVNIFKAFDQADTSHAREFEGLGLGLSLASRLVHAMGGKIELQSTLDEGSTFSFAVPLEERKPVMLAHSAPVFETLKGLGAMVVSNDPRERDELSRFFQRHDMAPFEADSIDMAMTLLEMCVTDDSPIPVVVLDSHLKGDASGFMLAHKIKNHPRLARTILIMIASKGRRGDAQLCKENGIAAYLSKPYTQTDLYDAVLAVTGAQEVSDKTVVLVTRHSLREQRATGKTVLLVEDNPDTQLLVAHVLQKNHYDAIIANNAAEALEILDKQTCDLILMDIQMPGMDGFAATEAIRKRGKDASGQVPIVALTAHAMAGYHEKCLKAGMNGYLTKPFKPDELLAAVEKQLNADIVG
jgi:two-component system, sensor histidine kinase and response regulator